MAARRFGSLLALPVHAWNAAARVLEEPDDPNVMIVHHCARPSTAQQWPCLTRLPVTSTWRYKNELEEDK